MKKYERWCHGHDGWRYSEDCECYYYKSPGGGGCPPDSYCLGERYIYCQPGLDSYGILWRGSVSGGWGCASFDFDLGEAIRWVQAAEAKEYGCKLWSKGQLENTLSSTS